MINPVLLICLFFTAATLAFDNFQSTPGGVAGVLLHGNDSQKPEAWFGNRQILVEPYEDHWVAIAGINWQQSPGHYVIKSRDSNGNVNSNTFSIKPVNRPVYTINIGESRRPKHVAPRYMKALESLLSNFPPNPENNPDLDHLLPTEVSVRYSYGWINLGLPKYTLPYPGLGVDNTNTIKLVNPSFGPVVKTATESGNQQLVIDHGGNVFSIFQNLASIDVASEDWVAKGANIGVLVGNRNKTLLPDWSVVMNQSFIDPLILVSRKVELPSTIE